MIHSRGRSLLVSLLLFSLFDIEVRSLELLFSLFDIEGLGTVSAHEVSTDTNISLTLAALGEGSFSKLHIHCTRVLYDRCLNQFQNETARGAVSST